MFKLGKSQSIHTRTISKIPYHYLKKEREREYQKRENALTANNH